MSAFDPLPTSGAVDVRCDMAKRTFDPAVLVPAIFDTGSPKNFADADWTGVELRLSPDPQAET